MQCYDPIRAYYYLRLIAISLRKPPGTLATMQKVFRFGLTSWGRGFSYHHTFGYSFLGLPGNS